MNLYMYGTFVVLFMIKSLAKEFLRKDPVYEGYLRRVRYRWIPGLM
jgi:hypothetical protein